MNRLSTFSKVFKFRSNVKPLHNFFSKAKIFLKAATAISRIAPTQKNSGREQSIVNLTHAINNYEKSLKIEQEKYDKIVIRYEALATKATRKSMREALDGEKSPEFDALLEAAMSLRETEKYINVLKNRITQTHEALNSLEKKTFSHFFYKSAAIAKKSSIKNIKK